MVRLEQERDEARREHDEARAERDQVGELLSVALEQLHEAHKREQRYRVRVVEFTTAARERMAA